MNISLFLLLSLFCTQALAFNQVDSALDENSVLVKLDPEHGFKKDERVVILSRTQGSLIAIGKVKKLQLEQYPEMAVVEIEEIIGNKLVLPSDAVERLTVEVLEKHHIMGHISLMLGQERTIPARYKDLAYMGVFNSDGHTLADKEWLVSIPQVQYGLTDSFTVKVLTGLYLDGFANIGAKARVMRNHWGQLTLNALTSRQVNRDDWVFQTGLVLTLPSNGRFQSHLVINARIEGIEEDNPEVDKLNLFPESDIRTIYEYVTDDWDRLLFGPSFNFQNQSVGGTISHMWIWDTFHLNLGIATKDVSELKFDKDGYYILLDFFWRF